jgi:hypothetical protein
MYCAVKTSHYGNRTRSAPIVSTWTIQGPAWYIAADSQRQAVSNDKHRSGEHPPTDSDTDRIERAAGEAIERGNARALVVISDKLDLIISRLAVGDTKLALLDHRQSSVEKIVYGLCGLALTAVATAVIAVVVTHKP